MYCFRLFCIRRAMSTEKSRNNSTSGAKRVSQWEELMRKFSQTHKEHCKTLSLEFPRVQRSVKQFPTGSQYEGTWDLLGMSGYGVYKFPNEVVYKGQFDDGMFHGDGDLIYPSGAVLRGKWKKGQLMDRTLIFADGLEYCENEWSYCKIPDRRFTIEYDKGLQPAGQSYLTAEQPTREIPSGYYDTGDGFYDPKTKVVYKCDDLSAIIRSPSVREQKWIIDNCRTSPEVALGPRQDLYEEWLEPEMVLPVPPLPGTTSRVASTDYTAQSFMDQEQEIIFDDSVSVSRINWRHSSKWYQRPFLKFEGSG